MAALGAVIGFSLALGSFLILWLNLIVSRGRVSPSGASLCLMFASFQ